MSVDLVRASDVQLDRIRERSRDVCVVLQNQEMPPGCDPSFGRVGVEQSGGTVSLLVDRCEVPEHVPGEVARWLRTGRRDFAHFEELVAWLRGPLTTTYSQAGGSAIAGTHLTEEGDRVPAPQFLEASSLSERIQQRVVGQGPALRVLAAETSAFLAQVAPRRPLTVLLVGPTGVGKTSAAVTLAETLEDLTGGEWGFVRVDGAEYQESHTTANLLGSPPGYIGYGDPTPLDVLRSTPRSVILIDEIDKVAPEVFRLLMGLMDYGTLRGSRGVIDGRRAVLLLTSNLAAEALLGELDGSMDDPDRIDCVVRERYRSEGVAPELMGRITSIALFGRLAHGDRLAIVELSVHRVAETYGVEVRAVERALLFRMLGGDIDAAAGARAVEYRVSRVLNPVLADVARAGVGMPIDLFSDDHGEWAWRVAEPLRTRS